MIPYIIVLTFLIFWVYFEKELFDRKAFWMPVITLSLFAGMRSFLVGTDTIEYVLSYIINQDFSNFTFRDDVEKGFQLFVYFLLKFNPNYFWLLFIPAFFIVISFSNIMKKYSDNYLLSVIIYITFGSYTFFFNGLRQGIAIAITTYALPFMIKKKFIKFFLITALASTFHTSALIMLPFYFIVNLKIKLIYKVFGILIGGTLLSRPAIEYFAKDMARYQGYTNNQDFGGLYTLAFFIFIALFITVMKIKLKISNLIFNKLYTFYVVGVSLLLPIASLGAGASGPQRILNYFTWTLVILLPAIFNKTKSNSINIAFVLFCIVYYYLTTTRFSNLTPYTLNKLFEVF